MNKNLLSDLSRLSALATKGPWKLIPGTEKLPAYICHDERDPLISEIAVVYRAGQKGEHATNAELIVALVNALPEILEMARNDASKCEWIENEEYWATGCGQSWVFMDANTPEAHGMKFCYHCGKTLSAKPYVEPPMDDEDTAIDTALNAAGRGE